MGPWRDVLSSVGIRNHWDAVIVCDGSGSGWGIGAGWASVVTTSNLRRSPLLTGAFSLGTVNIAEAMGVYQALMWLDSCGRQNMADSSGRILRIHIISDSELIVNQGNKKAVAKGPNRTIWRAIREYEREGWDLKFHWFGRDQIQLNQLCDHASRQARLAMEAIDVSSLLEDDRLSTYSFNPMDTPI